MALQPVSFRWDPGLVERIDRARGDVPRSVWVRRAVEQALGESPVLAELRQMSPAEARERYRVYDPEAPVPEPAQMKREDVSRADAFRRASSLAKRDVQPIPKGPQK